MNPTADRLRQLAEQYGIRDIYVFGSRAKEVAARVAGRSAGADTQASGTRPPEARASDVDLAVQPLSGRELGPNDRVRLTDDLERLLGARRVDLVVLSEARAFLATEVVKGELLYTSDAGAQAEHELYVLRRAADLAPFQRERVRLILTEGAR
jgi:uncharacterized protein